MDLDVKDTFTKRELILIQALFIELEFLAKHSNKLSGNEQLQIAKTEYENLRKKFF